MRANLRGLHAISRYEIVETAEAVPADKFAFAPTIGEFTDVRSFERFATFVESSLVSPEEFRPYLRYWIDDLATDQGDANDARWRNPAAGAKVPNLQRKPLDQISVWR